jgi:hypothetical protein
MIGRLVAAPSKRRLEGAEGDPAAAHQQIEVIDSMAAPARSVKSTKKDRHDRAREMSGRLHSNSGSLLVRYAGGMSSVRLSLARVSICLCIKGMAQRWLAGYQQAMMPAKRLVWQVVRSSVCDLRCSLGFATRGTGSWWSCPPRIAAGGPVNG